MMFAREVLCAPPQSTAGHLDRTVVLRGLPPTTGVLRGSAGESRAGFPRDELKPAVDYANTGN
jgi:hypothetical protein